MMQNALDFLYSKLHDPTVAGESVVYFSGNDSVTVHAVLEKSTILPLNLQGLLPGQFDFTAPSPKNVEHDFSILAADLVISGEMIIPQQGDQIMRTFNGSTSIYEVMPASQSKPAWEWQDGYDKRYMIHTRLVGAQ